MKQTSKTDRQRKKFPYIWQTVCIAIGIAVFLVTLLFWKDYFAADVKFKTEAVLSDIHIHAKQKLKSKEDRKNNPQNIYETYYEYQLEWRFTNPENGLTYSFEQERQASHEHAYSLLDKMDVYVYYNHGHEQDFEVVDPAYTWLLLIAGSALVLVPLGDILRQAVRQRKKKRTVGAV